MEDCTFIPLTEAMKIRSNRKMSALIVAILFAVIQSSEQTVYSCDTSAACGCSASSATVSRIVGGESVDIHNWSWAVYLSIANTYLCGGSILSSSWIITAAHCASPFSASQITVYAGSTTRGSGGQSGQASNVIVHPAYDPSTFVNDIALIRLDPPLDMTQSNLKPICLNLTGSDVLATSEWPPANTTVVAVGWGRLSDNGPLPSSLQQVTLQTVDRQASTCNVLVTDWRVQMCAGVSGGGKDTCQGDSGGPLMMYASTQQWVLVGLTSNGVSCASANYSGVYTRVSAFASWINATLNGSYTDIADSSILVARPMLFYSHLLTLLITLLAFRC